MWSPSPAHGGLGCVHMMMMMADAGLCGCSEVGVGQQTTDNGKMHSRCSWASMKAHLDPNGGGGGGSRESQLVALEDELMVSGPQSVWLGYCLAAP